MVLPKGGTWVVEGEYFYREHYKYKGIYELYWLDSDGTDHCVQNFCILENALAFAREDKLWRESNYPIGHKTRLNFDLNLFDSAKKKVLSWPGEEDDESKEEELRLKREARRKRRLAKKEQLAKEQEGKSTTKSTGGKKSGKRKKQN